MSSEPVDPPAPSPPAAVSRRALLRRGLALSGTLGGALSVAERSDAAPAPATESEWLSPPWMHEPGQPFSDYGVPSPYERGVIRRAGLNFRHVPGNGAAWTPLEQLEGTLTPNGLHFVRNHQGTPTIDPARHQLLVHGQVRQPLRFDLAALQRYPQRSQQIFLECGGNSSAGWYDDPVQRPVGLVHGLVSCSEWTGVPLALLLDEAGVDPQAAWVVAGGADASALHMSLPLAKAREDCLVALYQNGERLRPENGYPLRLIVPGCKGVLSVKWLRTLQLADQPAMGRNETARYTELLPSGQARQFTLEMEVKSLIVTPSHGQSLPGPGWHEIRGLAWSGRGRVRRVEVSTDGGAHWSDAALQEPVLPRCLTRFRLPWQWNGQPCVLQSRATDESGRLQPTRAQLVAERGTLGFYQYHGIVCWDVDRNGYVSHTYG